MCLCLSLCAVVCGFVCVCIYGGGEGGTGGRTGELKVPFKIQSSEGHPQPAGKEWRLVMRENSAEVSMGAWPRLLMQPWM